MNYSCELDHPLTPITLVAVVGSQSLTLEEGQATRKKELVTPEVPWWHCISIHLVAMKIRERERDHSAEFRLQLLLTFSQGIIQGPVRKQKPLQLF